MFLRASLVTASLVACASAHATWQEMWVNNVDFGGSCVRLPLSNSPVTDVTSNDIICNASPTPSANLCPAKAGDTITVEMHQQPGDRTCSTLAIGGAHYGPIMIYLAKVTDAKNTAATGLSWFKINEAGLVSSNPDYFANQVLNDNCGHWTFKLPTDIPAGQYLLRAETIALHAAFSPAGAQFYMSESDSRPYVQSDLPSGCFQLNISGGGTAAPATVKFPGAYSATDPVCSTPLRDRSNVAQGILINIYTQLNNYTIPGPAPYKQTVPTVATTAWPTAPTANTATFPTVDFTTLPGAAAGSGGSPPASSSAPPASSSAPPASSSAPPASGTVPKYGQCGGIGWTGGTVCAAGSKCTVTSAYYSQCL